MMRDRVRERAPLMTVEHNVQVIDRAIDAGAGGLCFSTHPTMYATLKAIHDRRDGRAFVLLPLLPYAMGYVRLATERGTIGSIQEILTRLRWDDRLTLLVKGVSSAVALDPIQLFRAYLDMELGSLEAVAPKNALIGAVFLHEVVTDGCVGFSEVEPLQVFYEHVRTKYHAVPGFVTRNLSGFVRLSQDAGLPLGDIAVMTPVNPLGFQMSPSREESERALSELKGTHVVAMSTLAAGMVTLEDAVRYLRTISNVSSVVVGTSQPSHASATFHFLTEHWTEGAPSSFPSGSKSSDSNSGQESADPTKVAVSFVLPCLNEADTLAECIRKAQRFLEQHKIVGEVIVADNGSTDGSQSIAHRSGAIVVPVSKRGYGSALVGGITAARGRFVVLGDADGSYDFGSVKPFIDKLEEGYDLVIGNRLSGTIMPGAMPLTNRWIGNPVLSRLGRFLFHAPIGDFHCGLRAFTKEAFNSLQLTTTGMEFASEMVAMAMVKSQRIAEVPITYYKDGRTRRPHLRPWRDGWRHLRFMLLVSPTWLFLLPGFLLGTLGIMGMVTLSVGRVYLGALSFDIHSLLVSGATVIIGFQLAAFGTFARIFAVARGLSSPSGAIRWIATHVTLERGLAFGTAIVILGLGLLSISIVRWASADFGELYPSSAMRLMIPAVICLTLGVQVIFSSFFLSVLVFQWPHITALHDEQLIVPTTEN